MWLKVLNLEQSLSPQVQASLVLLSLKEIKLKRKKRIRDYAFTSIR